METSHHNPSTDKKYELKLKALRKKNCTAALLNVLGQLLSTITILYFLFIIYHLALPYFL